MADQIKLTAAETQNMSNSFSDIGDDTKGGIEHLKAVIYAAFDVWKGSAAKAFEQEYNAAEQKMIKMYMELKETSKRIQEAANILQAKDDEAAQQQRQMNDGNDIKGF